MKKIGTRKIKFSSNCQKTTKFVRSVSNALKVVHDNKPVEYIIFSKSTVIVVLFWPLKISNNYIKFANILRIKKFYGNIKA